MKPVCELNYGLWGDAVEEIVMLIKPTSINWKNDFREIPNRPIG